MSELTFSFPVFVIADMLGLPSEDLAMFHRWAVEMICLPFNPQLGLSGSAKLAEYFAPIVAARRAEPRDDVISVLATSRLDGRSLVDQEIVDFLRFLLEAGAETTYRSSSNLLYGLLLSLKFSTSCERTAASCRRRSKRRCVGNRRSRWCFGRGT